MRRRRQVLQVSTFPFLAVLLCAMGSLILLLLVIDRRAKVVMRAKAMETVRQMELEDEKESANRAAEWERRRLALHDQLKKQKEDLEARFSSFQRQMTDISRELAIKGNRGSELENEIQKRQVQLHHQEIGIASRLQESAKKKQQSEAAQADLTRITADLLKLEQTLTDLKAFRKRQQQTYSLVPYRGRRGDNRRPIYLECAAGKLILHPDRMVIPASDSEGTAILQEVENRIRSSGTRQSSDNGGRLATSATDASQKLTPYLLLLVRPDGILTYYRTLSALRNLEVDFGYEFVEADWILSFPEDEKQLGNQPWMASGPVRSFDIPAPRHDLSPTKGIIGNSARASGPGSGNPAGEGNSLDGNSVSGSSRRFGTAAPFNFSTGQPGNGVNLGVTGGTFVSSANRESGRLGSGETGIVARPPGEGSRKSQTMGETGGESLPGGSGVKLGAAGPPGVRFEGSSKSTRGSGNSPSELGGPNNRVSTPREAFDRPRAFQNPSVNSLGSVGDGRPGHGQSSVDVARGLESQSTQENPEGPLPDPRSQAPLGNAPPDALLPHPANRTEREAELRGLSFPSRAWERGIRDDNLVASPPGSPKPGPQFPGSSGAGQPGVPSPPPLIPQVGPVLAGNTPTPSSAGNKGVATASEASGEGRRGESASHQGLGEGNDTGHFSAQSNFGGEPAQAKGNRDKKKEPSTLVRRYVRPEWNIFIECTAKEIIVYPGGAHISAASLGGSKTSNGPALLETIQEMILRRRALVATANNQGINPLPQIRFLVRPDGLRTYFLAFPELGPLNVALTRENLDADEDVIGHIAGR